MPTLVIRPRYMEHAKASERRAAVTSTLDALPSEISGRLTVISKPKKSSPETQSTTFVEAADEHAVERVRASVSSDVVVEEVIEFQKATFDLLRAGPLDLAATLRSEPIAQSFAGADKELAVNVKGPVGRRHVPLEGAAVYLVLTATGGVREVMRTKTDTEGDAKFAFASFYNVLSVIVVPYSQFWPQVIRGGSPGRKLSVVCYPLPESGPSGWWHKALGIRADASYGKVDDQTRIKIGVIDSGCGPHAAVEHVIKCGAFISGAYQRDGGDDSGAHGTHVCGIIGGNTQTWIGDLVTGAEGGSA